MNASSPTLAPVRPPRRRLPIRLALACLTVACAFPVLAASTPRDSLLVSAAWLGGHLADPDLVLLHVGDKEGYAAGHIAGARLTALPDVSISDRSESGLVLEMPPPEELRKRLEALGISDSSHVVVYYGKDWVSPSTRILFTLDHAGLGGRASLLDGGLGAWVAWGGAVTQAVPPARTGRLSPLQIRPLVVDAEGVRARLGKKGVALVDGRSAAFYDGVDTGESNGKKQRTGHIRGASSIPFTSMTDDGLMLKSKEELAALFAKAGVEPGDTVLGYCHIGMQATAVLFAARTLGHPVLLYDGSFQDWSRHPEHPVENPAEVVRK